MLVIYSVLYLVLPVLCWKSSEVHRERPRRDYPSKSILDNPACSNMRRFCGNLPDDLADLECLHSLHPNDLEQLSKECQQLVWDGTNNLIKDDNVIETLRPLCRNDLDRLNCNRDEGRYFECLATNKDDIVELRCQEMVKRMENVAFTDYKFLTKFLSECEHDIKQLSCGHIEAQGPSSQMATIVCLQNHIMDVAKGCQKEVYRLSEIQSDNIKLDQRMYFDCAEDYNRYCSQFHAGSGRVFHCLSRQDPQKLSQKCKESILRRQSLISQDYKVSRGLIRSCREDIRRSHCRKQTSTDKTVRLSQILLCLENVTMNGTKLTSDCEAELIEHRRMLMEDYRLSPELVDSCKRETAMYCKTFETGGKTIHCLMQHAQKRLKYDFSSACRQRLEEVIKASNVGENWKVDPVLHKACAPVVETVCKDISSGEARVMNCLMDHIGSDRMTEDCQNALIQIQYFISRRFKLDDQLYMACKSDAAKICGANSVENWAQTDDDDDSLVLPCLYRNMNKDSAIQLTPACLQNVKRVMKQRAMSVNLEPLVEEACVDSLALYCKNKLENGEEMQCLQEHYSDLEGECKKVISNYIEIQSEHAELNPYISKYCAKIIDTLCDSEAKNDEGDVMECLIKHKNEQIVKANTHCRASIEHFQIISLNDYKFSFKFKMACKPFAMRFCSESRSKSEVVRCLSEQVLNSTLSGIKGPIPRECKQQLKAQLFQQRESVDFDPTLKDACAKDIAKFCKKDDPKGLLPDPLECLQSVNERLSPACEKEMFRVKKQQVYDNSVDYALMTLCADAIEMFCNKQDKENVFECLKRNRDERGFNAKCRKVVNHRIVEQNSNYQLNPSLQQNCNADINKFCKNVLIGSNKNPKGALIKCLKEQFKSSRLTSKCEKEMASILREQALNVNLNPLIRTVCGNELVTICKTNDEDDDADSGDTEECLKDALLNSRIQTPACREEVANMIEESQADIQVDPLLQQACAPDLLTFCSDIPQGNGRHINCLKILLDTNKITSPKCKNMLKKRLEMYKNAALLSPVAPPEDFHQLYHQVATSPSKQYFFLVILMIIGSIFIGGMLCGRINQRKYMLLKSK